MKYVIQGLQDKLFLLITLEPPLERNHLDVKFLINCSHRPQFRKTHENPNWLSVKSSLTTLMRTHTGKTHNGEKPFKCKVCEKAIY